MWSTRRAQARLEPGQNGQPHRAVPPPHWRDSERRRLEPGDGAGSRVTYTLPERAITISRECIDPNLVSFFDSAPNVAEQYDRLAVALAMADDDAPLKRILIASASRGDGRTSVTLNLAGALASVGRRVLVVDSDLRRPSVLRLLGVEAQVGLAEVLSGAVSLNAATVSVRPCGFDVLPGCEGTVNSTRALGQPIFLEMLATFDQIYDFVLFDSPPLLEAAGSHLLAQIVDTTLLVVRAGRTSATHLAKAIAPLTRESLFGVVLNRVEGR